MGAAFVEYLPEKDPSGSGAQAIARLASNVIAAVGARPASGFSRSARPYSGRPALARSPARRSLYTASL